MGWKGLLTSSWSGRFTDSTFVFANLSNLMVTSFRNISSPVVRGVSAIEFHKFAVTGSPSSSCSWIFRSLLFGMIMSPCKRLNLFSISSEQSGTRVPKGRRGGDLPKISAFLANAPQSRGRGSSQGDKSPARTPRFSNNTGEGTASSAQSGRNRGPINRNPPLKPPGTIKTATKDKTKSKGKNTNS